MKIGTWSKGIETVEVDGEIKALLIHHGGEMTLWQYDAKKQMTTGKDFGVVTIEGVEKRYGKLEEQQESVEHRQQIKQTNTIQERLF